MKQKGIREQNPDSVRHRETTGDERIKVVTLRDEAGWNWTRIGAHLNIDRRKCQKIGLRLILFSIYHLGSLLKNKIIANI